MLKYVQSTIDRYKDFKKGINAHADRWAGQDTTASTIDADIKEIEDLNAEADDLEIKLQNKRRDLKNLVELKNKKADTIENSIIGVHASDANKTADYGIAPAATRQSAVVPGKANIASVEVDDDGQGFELTITRIPEAAFYEIEIAKTKAEVLTTSTPFPIVQTTGKTKFIFEDLVQGERCHFRVRAVNSAGKGEWSDVSVSGTL